MFVLTNIFYFWFVSFLVFSLLHGTSFYLLFYIYKNEYRNFWQKDIGKIKENDFFGYQESEKIKVYLSEWLFNPPWWAVENRKAKFLLLIFPKSAFLLFLIHPVILILIALFLQ